MSTKGKEYKLMVRIAGEVDKTFGTSLNTIKKDIKNVKRMTADETFSVIDRGFSKIENVGVKALNAIKRTAELATVAVAGIGIAATNAGSEFEAAMSTVEAISGANSSEMDELTEKARELGRNSVYSATEVADAMQYMGMAGWKTEEILAGIEPVLDLATASGEEFSMVSDIVTDNLTAFNMTAKDSKEMADVLAAAAMNSNTNVQKMGETFKYAGSVAGGLGFSIKDVAVATGLMASSGIKANMAGTALRNLFTRMAKPTKDSKEAMEAFGIELDDGTGKAKSLMEIMTEMRKNVRGMSEEEKRAAAEGLAGTLSDEEKKYYESLSEDELDALILAEDLTAEEKKQYEGMTQLEKAYFAAGLSGQRGMTGLLAILNASEKDFSDLVEAIYNSEGAAAEMAAKKTDNLKGDLDILKNNVNDAGIELYNTFSGTLRGWVQDGTELIQKVIKKIPGWVHDTSAHAATLKRKVGKFVEPIFNFIVDTGKWLIKHKNAVIGVIAGIGGALATYKIASTASHIFTSITNFFKMANPTALAITGIATAIGAVTGAIVAYNIHKQELIDADIAKHFGDLSLSISELNDVANAIVDNGSMAELKRQLEAFDELDILREDIQTHLDEIGRINWKISMGFELSAEEQENLRSEIEETSKLQQELAENTAYEVSQMFPDDDAISLKIKQFYLDNVDKMHTLGEELAKAVNEAYSGDLLNTEMIGNILDVQSQMAEVQAQISLGKQEASLALLREKYAAGTALGSESFQNLQKELEDVLKENEDVIDEAYQAKYAAAYATWQNGGLTDSEFAEEQQALKDRRVTDIVAQRARAAEFEAETILAAYSGEVNAYKDSLEAAIRKQFTEYNQEQWKTYTENAYWGLMYEIEKGAGLSDKATEGMKQLIENMEDQLNELFAYKTAGGLSEEAKAKVDEQIKAIQDLLIKAQGTSEDWESVGAGVFNKLNEMITSGDLTQAEKDTAHRIQEYIQYTKNAYVENAKMEIANAHDMTMEELKEAFKNGYDVEAELRLRLNTVVEAQGSTKEQIEWEVRKVIGTKNVLNPLEIGHNASGGLIKDMQLSWLAEQGPEMVVPLDGSRRAFSLWEQAGHFMNNSLMDRYDISGGDQGTKIEYNPVLQFYGGTPDSGAIEEALRISQDEFEDMMEKYLRKRARLAF